MPIVTEPFGDLRGVPVSAHTLTAPGGLRATVIDYGARLTRMHVPDRTGVVADVTLGFDDLAAYVATDHYFGATCGRYGNRIREGRFMLDGRPVRIAPNEGPNTLHGGPDGFDRRIWHTTPDEAANAVTFTTVSVDGDQGFPGTLALTARYELTSDGRLVIEMSGTTDAVTVLNMVNHAYWNMAGQGSGDILGQHMTLAADFYTPVDEALLPTGEVRAVAGTPFDFRAAKSVGRDIDAEGVGYDHNWVLRQPGPGLREVATLWDPVSGRGLALRGTGPGVQVYVGGAMTGAMIGKGGTPYRRHAGTTFETQAWPDAPNHAHFPAARLDPGTVYRHRMEYAFFAR